MAQLRQVTVVRQGQPAWQVARVLGQQREGQHGQLGVAGGGEGVQVEGFGCVAGGGRQQ